MSETLLPGRITIESEFTGGSGACGPAIWAAQARWSKQAPIPTVKTVVPDMSKAIGPNGKALCSPTGVTDTPSLRIWSQRAGFTVENPSSGMAPWLFAARALLATGGYHQGMVCMQLRNGQALREYLTGSGEDATNLRGHFIGLVGYNPGGFSNYFGLDVPQGFLAIDGDQNQQNPIINGARVHRQLNTQLCYYSLQVIQAAQPYDAYSILPQAGDPLTVALDKLSTIQRIAGS